jgi:hypothetical protein
MRWGKNLLVIITEEEMREGIGHRMFCAESPYRFGRMTGDYSVPARLSPDVWRQSGRNRSPAIFPSVNRDKNKLCASNSLPGRTYETSDENFTTTAVSVGC